jgi:hypothetical protein
MGVGTVNAQSNARRRSDALQAAERAYQEELEKHAAAAWGANPTRGVPPREELTAAAYLELKRLRKELDSARQAYEDSAD